MNTEVSNHDVLIAENQRVGDGVGWACSRNLYERPDGSRYSVKTFDWEWIESNDRVKK